MEPVEIAVVVCGTVLVLLLLLCVCNVLGWCACIVGLPLQLCRACRRSS